MDRGGQDDLGWLSDVPTSPSTSPEKAAVNATDRNGNINGDPHWLSDLKKPVMASPRTVSVNPVVAHALPSETHLNGSKKDLAMAKSASAVSVKKSGSQVLGLSKTSASSASIVFPKQIDQETALAKDKDGVAAMVDSVTTSAPAPPPLPASSSKIATDQTDFYDSDFEDVDTAVAETHVDLVANETMPSRMNSPPVETLDYPPERTITQDVPIVPSAEIAFASTQAKRTNNRNVMSKEGKTPVGHGITQQPHHANEHSAEKPKSRHMPSPVRAHLVPMDPESEPKGYAAVAPVYTAHTKPPARLVRKPATREAVSVENGRGRQRKLETQRAKPVAKDWSNYEESSKLENLLNEARMECHQAKEENRTLKMLMSRQEKAIKALEIQGEDFPRLIKSLQEEIRILREKSRGYMERIADQDRRIQAHHQENQEVRSQLEKAKKILKQKGLENADGLQVKLKQLETAIEEKDTEISELKKKDNLQSKQRDHEVREYRIKNKLQADEIAVLRETIGQMELAIKEKDHILAIQSIYSNRISANQFLSTYAHTGTSHAPKPAQGVPVEKTDPSLATASAVSDSSVKPTDVVHTVPMSTSETGVQTEPVDPLPSPPTSTMQRDLQTSSATSHNQSFEEPDLSRKQSVETYEEPPASFVAEQNQVVEESTTDDSAQPPHPRTTAKVESDSKSEPKADVKVEPSRLPVLESRRKEGVEKDDVPDSRHEKRKKSLADVRKKTEGQAETGSSQSSVRKNDGYVPSFTKTHASGPKGSKKANSRSDVSGGVTIPEKPIWLAGDETTKGATSTPTTSSTSKQSSKATGKDTGESNSQKVSPPTGDGSDSSAKFPWDAPASSTSRPGGSTKSTDKLNATSDTASSSVNASAARIAANGTVANALTAPVSAAGSTSASSAGFPWDGAAGTTKSSKSVKSVKEPWREDNQNDDIGSIDTGSFPPQTTKSTSFPWEAKSSASQPAKSNDILQRTGSDFQMEEEIETIPL